MNKLKIFLIILVLFSLGVATGSILTHIHFEKGLHQINSENLIEQRSLLIKKLSKKLELNHTQKLDIAKIMDKSFAQILLLREKNKPEIIEIFNKRNSLIKDKLNIDQKKKFDELLIELSARRVDWENKLKTHSKINATQI